MQYLILISSIIVLIKTISYGIYEIKKNSNLPRWYFRNNYCYYCFGLSKRYNLYSRIITYTQFLKLMLILQMLFLIL